MALPRTVRWPASNLILYHRPVLIRRHSISSLFLSFFYPTHLLRHAQVLSLTAIIDNPWNVCCNRSAQVTSLYIHIIFPPSIRARILDISSLKDVREGDELEVVELCCSIDSLPFDVLSFKNSKRRNKEIRRYRQLSTSKFPISGVLGLLVLLPLQVVRKRRKCSAKQKQTKQVIGYRPSTAARRIGSVPNSFSIT